MRSFIATLLLATAVLGTACVDDASLSLALPKKLRIKDIAPEQRALLRANMEIKGLLADSELAFDDAHENVKGAFLLTADKSTQTHVVVRVFGRFSPTSDEVLLGIADKAITIEPRSSVYLDLGEADWTVSGPAILDLNGNAVANVDDLASTPSVDPAPPKRTLAVLPDALQFPSGVRPGEFTRQVIVVENNSGLAQTVTPTVVGGQGISITRIDPTGAPEGGAPRTLAPFTMQPFQEVLLAVTFAPTNEFLVRGSIALETLQPDSNVASVSEVTVIANSDGEPEQAAVDYDPGTVDAGALGLTTDVIPFPPASLFGGQPISPGTVQLSADPSDTVLIPTVKVSGESVGPLSAGAVFLVGIPPKARLSVSLDGLKDNLDLGLFILDSGAVSAVAEQNITSAHAGTAAESAQFRNTSGSLVQALIVLSRVDEREPGDATDDGGAPYSLLAQLNSGPEFTDPPLSRFTGDFRGGNDIDLNGVDFQDGAIVLIGGHPTDRTATSTNALGTQISTITPPGNPDDLGSALSVVAINPNGEAATLPDVFHYDSPKPEIDDVDPPTATTTGGTPLFIQGAFFSHAHGGPNVLINDVPVPGVVFVDANHVTLLAPPGTAGFTTLVVQNIEDGGSTVDSASFPFVYVAPIGDPPTIDSITPDSGPLDVENPVSIAGANFANGASVHIGGSVPDALVITPTLITGRMQTALVAGPVDVVVTNPDGRSATLAGGFTFVTLPPAIVGASPTAVSTLGGTRVFVDGSGFRSGVAAFFQQDTVTLAAVSTTFVSPTRLIAISPTGLSEGAATLFVQNADGQRSPDSAVTVVAPTALPPRVLSLNPSTMRVDALGTVSVTGSGFQTGMIAFFDSDPLPIANLTATGFTFEAPTHSTGAAIVRVENPDGQTDASALVYENALGPVFNSVSPGIVSAFVPGDVVTVAGQNLVAITGNNVHLLDGAGTEYDSTLVSSTDTTLRVRIADQLPERGDFVISADFATGNAISPAFAAIAPALLSQQALSPPVDGGNFTLLLQGSSLNHTKITAVRFVRADDGLTVEIVPAVATDSVLRVDANGRLAQGSWSIFVVYGFTNTLGQPAEFRISVGDAAGNPVPFVVSGQCGNNVVDAGEECDGAVFPLGASCNDFGFFGGSLVCDSNCHVRTTQCTRCGDGIVDATDGEECDGSNLAGATCNQLFPGSTGTPTCTNRCLLSASSCAICGNGQVEGAEECDSNNLNGATCATLGLGFNIGQVSCDPQTCQLDGSLCSTCGNNRCDTLENNANCPGDCLATCGNHTCDATESCTTCPGDCGGNCTAPFSLSLTSGNAQSRTFMRDTASPVVVHVQDGSGAPLVGVQLAFTAPSGARANPALANTDASGNASAILTLARTLGVQSFSVTGTGPDAHLLVGAPLAITATATDLGTKEIVTIANNANINGRTVLLGAGNAQVLPPATKTLLTLDPNGPSGVAVRADGAVFVSDSNNHRIVRIDPDGKMVHIAGSSTGTAGFTGDNGPALTALLSQPRGLALDAAGNLFIADVNNARIRRVDAVTGAITTFAGGGANPQANDGDGNLATLAFLNVPQNVAVNPTTGDVFIACDGSNTIRKVPASGVISTVVTTGGCTNVTGPRPADINFGAMAFDTQGRLVFNTLLSDFGGCVGTGEAVLRLENNGSFSFLAGGGAADGEGIQARGAHIFTPIGIAVDSGNNVYVAERASGVQGRRVRKFSSIGVATTLVNLASTLGAGGDGGPASAAQLSIPGELAFGPNGDLVLTDPGNQNVRLIRSVADSSVPTFSMTPFGGGQTTKVAGIVSQAVGVTITSGGTPIPGITVTATASAGAAIEASTPITDGSGRASFLAFAGRSPGTATFTFSASGLDGVPLTPVNVTTTVTDVAANTIYPIVNQRGQSGSTLSGSATRTLLAFASNNMGMAVDPNDDSIVIADSNNHRVVRVDSAGALSVIAGNGTAGFTGDGGQATSATLRAPRGVAIDKDSNVYIADTGNAVVRVVDRASGVISIFAGSGAASGNNGDGQLATGANLSNPTALAIGPTKLVLGVPSADSQALFIVDDGHNAIRRVLQVDPANPGISEAISSVVTSAGCTAAVPRLGSFGAPGALAFDLTGRLYISGNVSDFGGCAVSGTSIMRLETDGSLTPIAGGTVVRATGAAVGTSLNALSGLAVDGLGNIYLAEHGAHVIRKIDVLGRISVVAGQSGLAGFTGDYGDAGAAKLSTPSQLAFTAAGDLLVLDTGNFNVREIRLRAATVADVATMSIAAGDAQTVTIGQLAPAALRVHIVDGGNNPIPGLNVAFTAPDLGDTVLQALVTTNTNGDASTQVRLGFDTSVTQSHRVVARVQTALDPRDIAGSPQTFHETAARPAATTAVALLNSAGTGGSTALPIASTEVRASIDFGGVARAADGTLYVADTFNHRIIEISPEGEAALFAGTGVAGFNDNTAATLGQLSSPRGLAVDDVGNVFIADTGNGRIRVVDLLGNITTYAGGSTGTGCSGAPTGANLLDVRQILFNPATKDLIVLDHQHQEICKIAPNAAAFGDEVMSPVASVGNGRVGSCTSATGLRPNSWNGQHAMALDNTRATLYFGGFVSNGGACPSVFSENIFRLDLTTGLFSLVLGNGASTADGPTAQSLGVSGTVAGMVVLPNGDLLFSEQSTHRIRRIVGGVGTGAVQTILGTSGSTGFSSQCTGIGCLLNTPTNMLLLPTGDVVYTQNGTESIHLVITP